MYWSVIFFLVERLAAELDRHYPIEVPLFPVTTVRHAAWDVKSLTGEPPRLAPPVDVESLREAVDADNEVERLAALDAQRVAIEERQRLILSLAILAFIAGNVGG